MPGFHSGTVPRLFARRRRAHPRGLPGGPPAEDVAGHELHELAHDVAVHIAFARPKYLSRADVPADVLEHERQTLETISRKLADHAWDDVPEAMLLYRNPGTNVEAGLRRRREAEGRLWAKGHLKVVEAPQQPAKLTTSSPFTARITPHITLGEFALDQEARRFDHQHQIDTAAELAAFLERVRTAFGGKPIIITSGYRPAAINRAVGGATSSEHLYSKPGEGAVDFVVHNADMQAVQRWCDKEWKHSLGYAAPNFIHLGRRADGQRRRWDYT
jgi:hypothetical protein